MTPEQDRALHAAGWVSSHRNDPPWDLKRMMAVKLGIKPVIPHKDELWSHVEKTVDAMDHNEILDHLNSEENLDALAARILLTQ